MSGTRKPGPGASSPSAGPRSLSVVVPVFEEEANAEALVDGLVEVLRPLGIPFEIIVVDDGSGDGTLGVLRRVQRRTPELCVMALRRNFGQTLALQAGFDRARGEVIVTLDGDLQNDPRDIPRLVDALASGADVVSGWRRDRKDALVVRKVPSWVANWLIRKFTGVPVHDQGCSLKAYRADVVRGLDLYADMHRFVAVLSMAAGARLAEVVVRHHPRVAGRSKYGLSRVLKVIADLMTIQMLTRFRESPIRWFSLLAVPFVAALAAALLALGIHGTGTVVLPAVALVSAATATGCVTCGLVAELMLSLRPGGRREPALHRSRPAGIRHVRRHA